MGITCRTPQSAVSLFLKKAQEIAFKEISTTLSYLGEQCVAKIRDRAQEDSWIDHTGNLRSSIGYAVYSHGLKTIESSFPIVYEGTDGQNEGRKMIEELAKSYSQTYALVVVAGMSYADYVEAIESKDVLASTEIWAKTKIDSYMKKARDKALKKINTLEL